MAHATDADMASTPPPSEYLLCNTLTSACEAIVYLPPEQRANFLNDLIDENPAMSAAIATALLNALVVDAEGRDEGQCYGDHTELEAAEKLYDMGGRIREGASLNDLVFRMDLPLIEFVLNKVNGIGRHCITDELKRIVYSHEAGNRLPDEALALLRGMISPPAA